MNDQRALWSDHRSTPDLVAFVLLLAVQIGSGFLATIGVLLSQMAYSGCFYSGRSRACNFVAGDVAMWGLLAVVVLSIAGAIGGGVHRRHRGLRIWWLPLAGLGLVVVAFIASVITVQGATA
jgi:hypothetical protein